MTNGDRLARLETVLKGLARTAPRIEDCELSDEMGRGLNHALDLLEVLQLRADETGTAELAAAA